jgi:hypothetical protein
MAMGSPTPKAEERTFQKKLNVSKSERKREGKKHSSTSI